MKRRNTIQRDLVLDAVKTLGNHATAEEIYEQVEDKEILNYSTVYRTLNTLSEKGALIKTGEPGGKMYFQLLNRDFAVTVLSP